MRRRLVADTASGDAVPAWVLESRSYATARRQLITASRPVTADELHTAHVILRSRGQQWCADRSLSYCATVLGWAKPSPREQHLGLTGIGTPRRVYR